MEEGFVQLLRGGEWDFRPSPPPCARLFHHPYLAFFRSLFPRPRNWIFSPRLADLASGTAFEPGRGGRGRGVCMWGTLLLLRCRAEAITSHPPFLEQFIHFRHRAPLPRSWAGYEASRTRCPSLLSAFAKSQYAEPVRNDFFEEVERGCGGVARLAGWCRGPVWCAWEKASLMGVGRAGRWGEVEREGGCEDCCGDSGWGAWMASGAW